MVDFVKIILKSCGLSHTNKLTVFVSTIGCREDDTIAIDGQESVGGLQIELDDTLIPQLILCVCVRACVRACVHACVCMCVHASMCVCAYMCVRVCVRVCVRALIHIVWCNSLQ